MHWAGKYTEDADIVIEYEPHEKLTHAELLDEMHELRSWVEEGRKHFLEILSNESARRL